MADDINVRIKYRIELEMSRDEAVWLLEAVRDATNNADPKSRFIRALAYAVDTFTNAD